MRVCVCVQSIPFYSRCILEIMLLPGNPGFPIVSLSTPALHSLICTSLTFFTVALKAVVFKKKKKKKKKSFLMNLNIQLLFFFETADM